MKKLITIFAAIAVLAVSCQQEDIINNEEGTGITTGITTGKLTARFAGTTTRVGYTVMDYDDDWNWNFDYDDNDYWMGLLPAWEVGDEIIGFDDDGHTYTLTVASIDAGTATLSGTVPDGNLHLIYKYDAQASDISNKTLAVDYSSQVGDDETMPAVMLADGTVVGGSCDFIFTNAGAVIDVWFMKELPVDTKVTKVTLSGENLSAATIAMDGGALALTATENAEDAITIDGLDLTVVEDESVEEWGNVLSSPVRIAVPGEAVITKVTVEAKVPDPEPEPIPSLDPASTDYVTIGGKKWAKWNIGAENEKDCGWYFSWGGMERYYRNNAWRRLPPVVSTDYPWDTDQTICAGTYYLPEPSFVLETGIIAYKFEWKYTPFNNGNTNIDYTNFENIMDDVCPVDGDGNRNLVSAYDAAHVIWGGTWRMPTYNDFMDLILACGGAYKTELGEVQGAECTTTPLPSANPGKGIYWVSAEQTYISDYTGVAGVLFCDGTSKLFFPAGGFGWDVNRNTSENRYWSSTLHSAKHNMTGNAKCLRFDTNDTKVHTDYNIRAYGEPIRPVSD